MKPVPTWLMPPPSISTRRETSTKKMFITFGCSLVDSNPRLHQHRRRPRLQRQRRRLHLRLRLHRHRHLLPLQRQDLLLLQGPFPRQGGDLHHGRDPELPAIGDRATASSKVDRLLRREWETSRRRRKYQAANPSRGCGTNALRTTRSTPCSGYRPCGSKISVSILLPNLPHKLLDKVVVLNKENASVNAPLPLHGKVNIRY